MSRPMRWSKAHVGRRKEVFKKCREGRGLWMRLNALASRPGSFIHRCTATLRELRADVLCDRPELHLSFFIQSPLVLNRFRMRSQEFSRSLCFVLSTMSAQAQSVTRATKMTCLSQSAVFGC
ncbi:hypothetical protein IE81DRAFT_169018 [Ceraceosorus guamensis]|uniref:Uncharacterized protein n=1 Tax=Ceraceosorus guamensis TaxID=1522189 RepID=A0A316VWD6_9BASI|nr:hypothetical protein IE81DRAFT_169018 [Ceraceosorus guamensis]PWN41614.1 hypothetical protein IE81DRAFT_169018 [Ceraceosorus guamensis]